MLHRLEFVEQIEV